MQIARSGPFLAVTGFAMKHYLELLGRAIGPQKKSLAGVFCLFILLSFIEAFGVGLIVPLIASLELTGSAEASSGTVISVVSDALAAAGISSPGQLFALVAVIFYLKAIVGYHTQQATFRFGYKNQKRLIDTLVERYQAMPLAEFQKQDSAALIQNLIGNVEIVTQGAIVAAIRLASEATVALAITVVLLMVQPVITLLMVVAILVAVSANDTLIRQRIHQTGRQAAETRELVIRNFQAVMRGFKEIHVIGRMDYFNKLIFLGTSELIESAVSYKTLNSIPRYLMECVAVTGFAAIFILGGMLGIPQSEIIATIGTFAVAALRLIPGSNQLAASIIHMRNSHFALTKVDEGLREIGTEPGISGPSSNESPHNPAVEVPATGELQRIEFRNVCFRHSDKGDLVLDDANIIIEKGQLVGFRGHSGSGKTTALDLILGFLQPSAGEVLLNGRCRKEDPAAWYPHFVYVSQESFLFSGSIRENITLGSPERIDRLSLSAALELSCLEEFIAGLPDGVESHLGERGVNISGGERQRVALARALYLDRPIIVLDEPTSALDAVTAHKVMANFRNMVGRKTIIVTSHDPSILELCDSVYDFSAGHVRHLAR